MNIHERLSRMKRICFRIEEDQLEALENLAKTFKGQKVTRSSVLRWIINYGLGKLGYVMLSQAKGGELEGYLKELGMNKNQKIPAYLKTARP
jgi:hypothetical protein